ncbi:hypothetical protein SteCoe_17237 [Stentor coeruleus]|uniref:Peptidase M14 domain-containing protein n=1 Tax=Stentor coeruleus TaxID=5963 RepID=A0A1R2BZJ0_9CILI|nr:hypothetical protein SteCoe_17237 [Stentor coeruleus]
MAENNKPIQSLQDEDPEITSLHIATLSAKFSFYKIITAPNLTFAINLSLIERLIEQNASLELREYIKLPKLREKIMSIMSSSVDISHKLSLVQDLGENELGLIDKNLASATVYKIRNNNLEQEKIKGKIKDEKVSLLTTNKIYLLIEQGGDILSRSSEELLETESKLKTDFEDFRDMLPPPIPLLPKSLNPSEPLFQCQNIPFEILDLSFCSEPICSFGPAVSPSDFPSKFDPSTSLKSLFPKETLVYLRSPGLYKKNFNENMCDLKKLLLKRRNRETKDERLYTNPLLLPTIPRYFIPNEDDNTLVFESRFESGNLAMASKVSENEYNLLLQSDINSKGHTQWFFFSVENTKADQEIKFNLLNFAKSDSLYNEGMKVLVYSMKATEKKNMGWTREGYNLKYYPNGIGKDTSTSLKSFYSLTFTYKFVYSKDRVFFAYSLPFLYSTLQILLDSYESDKTRSQYFHRKTLCKSIGGNNCDYLTITNKGTLEEIKNKRAVIISARVHPGETVGSWMMLGVLDFLTSNNVEAHSLRNKYIFKIVPMLNPDGVINGNYRCSLVGADLNRRWKNPQLDIHPIIHNFKRIIKNTAINYEIDLICDLHGHSRKNNIFMYGCDFQRSPQTCKLFPYILSKISPIFSFEYSHFGVQKSKESTMRVALFKDLKIPNIFTLEASFCGADFGVYKNMHFTGEILSDMGRDLCKSLLILSQNSALARNPTVKRPVLKNFKRKDSMQSEPDTEMFITKEHNVDFILKELMARKEVLHPDNNTSSSGSESEPSEDNLEFEELKGFFPIHKTSLSLNKKKIETPKVFHNHRLRFPLKKCERCGEDDGGNHVCKNLLSYSQIKRTVVGLRTYYNLAGKKVHDQATQTPPSFYEKNPRRRFLSSIGPLPMDNDSVGSSSNFKAL